MPLSAKRKSIDGRTGAAARTCLNEFFVCHPPRNPEEWKTFGVAKKATRVYLKSGEMSRGPTPK